MKKFGIIFFFILIVSGLSYSQSIDKDRGKSAYTTEEIIQMCGVPVNHAKINQVLAKQDSMYQEYTKETKTLESKLLKSETIPNWQGMMSDVENQGNCGDCWVHAASGIAEGQIHLVPKFHLGTCFVRSSASLMKGNQARRYDPYTI